MSAGARAQTGGGPWRAWLLALALLLGQAAAQAGPAPGEVQELVQARLQLQGVETPVQLPSTLTRAQFDPAGERLTYRLALELPGPPAEPLALFIVKASRAARVRVNGHDLGSCAPGPLEHVRCAQAPLYFQPPATVWQAGSNRIEVEVFANGMQTNGLSRVVVGPAARVFEERLRPALFWRQGLVMAVNWAIVAFGVMAFLIGVRYVGSQRPMYLWFGLACMLRAVSQVWAASSLVHEDGFWIQWLFTAARLVSLPVMMLSLLSFFDKRLPWIERGLMGYALALPVLSALSGARTDIALLLAAPGVLVALYLLQVLVRWTLTSRSLIDLLLLGALASILVFGLYDVWVLGSTAGFERPMALPLANGVLLVALGSVIVGKMASALVMTSNVNDVLREKVAAAEADLRLQHLTIVDLERRHAQVEAREQLLRDLHDGLGSNLASARILLEDQSLEPEQMRQLLDDCIDDMRLMLDSSGPQAQLADALGSLRFRLDRRLQASAVRVQWSLSLDALPPLADQARLQLLRLLQEALTNALRHSGARRILVTARHDGMAQELFLSVADDGRGIAAGASQGRGLANMRHRAARIGAKLDLRSDAEGTVVAISWPLQPA